MDERTKTPIARAIIRDATQEELKVRAGKGAGEGDDASPPFPDATQEELKARRVGVAPVKLKTSADATQEELKVRSRTTSKTFQSSSRCNSGRIESFDIFSCRRLR